MSMNRRRFLTAAAGGTLTAVAAQEGQAALQREEMHMPPKAVGMLYDSTLCIGCKACVAACKQANGYPAEIAEHHQGWNDGQWDSPQDISGDTLNVIKAYISENIDYANPKKDDINGYAFMKRHCLHCLDPSCVSVCPVSAMLKDPETGIVTHHPEACIGCRYCVVSCPFSVPQFEYNTPFPQIHKCQFCDHLQAQGLIPACCDVCPTGASLFGDAQALQEEAHRRLTATPGETYHFARGQLENGYPGHDAPLAQYEPQVYGERELGGTQVVYLAGLPIEKLGLPVDVPDHSYASLSEGIQHFLYKGMIAPLLLLTGLSFFAYRHKKQQKAAEQAAQKGAE